MGEFESHWIEPKTIEVENFEGHPTEEFTKMNYSAKSSISNATLDNVSKIIEKSDNVK